MAICKWCKQEMNSGVSCTGNTVKFPDGEEIEPIPYSPDYDSERCHDCYTPRGGIHHPGCDMEQCPRCGGQLISCSCWDSGNAVAGIPVISRLLGSE